MSHNLVDPIPEYFGGRGIAHCDPPRTVGAQETIAQRHSNIFESPVRDPAQHSAQVDFIHREKQQVASEPNLEERRVQNQRYPRLQASGTKFDANTESEQENCASSQAGRAPQGHYADTDKNNPDKPDNWRNALQGAPL
jgi:hypothetical protein